MAKAKKKRGSGKRRKSGARRGSTMTIHGTKVSCKKFKGRQAWICSPVKC